MKAKVLFLAILLSVVTVSALNVDNVNVKEESENPLQGNWREVDERKVAGGLTAMKLFTGTRYIWMIYDSQKTVIQVGSGTYTIEGDRYVETITANSYAKELIGRKGYINFRIEGKIMTISGYLEMESNIMPINEVWEKID